MMIPNGDWKVVFKSIGDDHVQLVGYAGEYSMPVERLYQAFKERLLSEINFGNAVKKEKP